MKKYIINILLLILIGVPCRARATIISMSQLDMKADGITLNTKEIQQAIDSIGLNGGGVLYFPPGKYLTGALKLCDNLTIELSSGAELIFSDDFSHYLPFVEMRFEGVMMKSFCPLLYACDKQNITIKGKGTLNGQGRKWWEEALRIRSLVANDEKFELNHYQVMWKDSNQEEMLYADNEKNFYPTLKRCFFRPPFIQFLRCENVTIKDITIINSPFWTINPELCQNILIDGVTIINPKSPNTDGINPSSCKDVRITNCAISVGDDCIAIKSGRDAQARRIGFSCENILISNCIMHSGHGGVVIGSEMSAGVRNVLISNCVFDGTDRGIRIKSRYGRGGVVEGIIASNLVMRNISKEAIIVDLYYGGIKDTIDFLQEKIPVVRNININSVVGYDINQAILIRGIKQSMVSDVTFSNLNLQSKYDKILDFCKNIRFNQVYINDVLQ
ncbi:glycoside hydrolase family 28 protein [Phocaeicola coprocola]|uniref:glycoside hydrolase family 28 protein n=1 Tax=Phocaeicola coprocola TaxID=310298 RepID=UPI00266FBAED|nr:glycoside hydrolase family 28 protein [Phocaeicola coprocola]